MNPPIPNPIPEIYVLWHPRCELGEFLARKIHGWLRPGFGLGPQVFYRSLPAPEAPAGGLPPPLPGESRGSTGASTAGRVSNLQIVLPLIDAHMIADPAWRYWLTQLAASAPTPGAREFMPVALDSTAFNAPERLREKNFLRPTKPAAEGAMSDAAKEALSRSLLKQLTEAMCRLMLGRATDPTPNPLAATEPDATAPKVKIFLSHAKLDGTEPARRIRDYIYGQTQLAAFYDENDIPFGSVFNRVLNQNLQGGETAALIAVRSARYASRPWCRRELSLFRRPVAVKRDPATGEPDPNSSRWQLSPVLVVEAIEGGERTVGIPELGNAPLIRWSSTVPDQEEEIVTTVLRDAVLAAFHSAVGRTLPEDADTIILNWQPDPTTLLHIPRVQAAGAGELRVFHPGRDMSALEREIFAEFFPTIEFHSFEKALS